MCGAVHEERAVLNGFVQSRRIWAAKSVDFVSTYKARFSAPSVTLSVRQNGNGSRLCGSKKFVEKLQRCEDESDCLLIVGRTGAEAVKLFEQRNETETKRFQNSFETVSILF